MDPGAFVVNRTLERERWARDKLAAHAGRTVRFKVGPASVTWTIEDDGRVRESSNPPELALTVSPLRLPALLAQPSRWEELVEVDGDSALATTFEELSLALPMLVEQSFARVLGPIAGAFVADTGRRLLAFPEYAAKRFGDSAARYAIDEAGLGVRGSEARRFFDDVAALASRVDALSARIDAIDAAASRRRRR
ncbi:MAG TPA: SCP2 sterol-binding domain-containing protein [Casimicrobiaceae bacterium]|nr:SCP2 sterol-binding domain-containing protein [Casimicrobiaceae bacterium]